MTYKILLISFGFYPEQHGVAEVAYRHALGFHTHGHEVSVLTRPCRQKREVPFEVWDFDGKKADYQSLLKSWPGDFIFFHGWHTWVSDWAAEVLPSLQATTIMVSHGTTVHLRYAGVKGWLRWLLQRPKAWRFEAQMRGFDHFVFLSDWPDLSRLTDVFIAQQKQWPNVSYIPNAASWAEYVSKGTFSKPADQKMLLCVSNFRLEKGQRELMLWFLEMQLPDTILVLIGNEPNAFSAQLEQLAGKSLNKSVFIYYNLSKQTLMDAYCLADVFVSATHTEVQPLMLLDAMAAGVPFLCRNVGAVGTLVGGEVFDNKNEFQSKLRLLLAHSSLRVQLGQAGKNAVKETYNWHNVTERYQQLIQQLRG